MILFDTETTGLIANQAIPLKSQPQIVELYALKFDDADLALIPDSDQEFIDGLLDKATDWESLFHVKKMEPEALKAHGITLEQLKNEPVFAERYESLCEFFAGERTMIAHNLAYDRDMLVLELRRMSREAAFPWPWRHICTVEATESMNGFRQSLTMLHEELFNEPFPEAHRARNDVRAMARVVLELIKRGIIRL